MAATTKIWVNNSAPQVDDVDLNGFKNENNNLIDSAGLTPNTADNDQTTKAVAIYAAGGSYYTDSGAADSYILTPFGSKLSPPAYFEGMQIAFVPANSNTAASVINVNGLGSKSLTDIEGNALTADEVVQDVLVTAYYDGTKFRLIDYNPLLNNVAFTNVTNTFTLYQKIPVPYAKVSFSSTQTQSLSSSTLITPVKVTYAGSPSGTTSWWDAANNRFKPTIPGRFKITAKNSVVSGAVTTAGINLYLNGSVYEGMSQQNLSESVLGGNASVVLDGINDYVEIYAGGAAAVTLGHNVTFFVGNASQNNIFEIEYMGT
jgi:hypothetical protein